jgi:Flp pilus assembly protein TadB
VSYQAHGEIPGEEEEMNVLLLFPIAIVAIVFTFAGVAHWVDSQRKEREAYYKTETLRRVTEASGEGAKAAIELMREDERLKRIKAREGMKIAGLINIAVGVGAMVFLHAFLAGTAIYLGGMVPLLVGAGFIVYVYFLASPVE